MACCFGIGGVCDNTVPKDPNSQATARPSTDADADTDADVDGGSDTGLEGGLDTGTDEPAERDSEGGLIVVIYSEGKLSSCGCAAGPQGIPSGLLLLTPLILLRRKREDGDLG